MNNFIQTEMLSAGRYLSRPKTIKVPEYQRSYAWTDDEVTQLWDDLLDSMTNGRPEYFIGPIVVKTTGTAVELIDGQQRLTTLGDHRGDVQLIPAVALGLGENTV